MASTQFPRAIQGTPIGSPSTDVNLGAIDSPKMVSHVSGGIGSEVAGGTIQISQETLKQLDEFISANEQFVARLPILDDLLAQTLAQTCDAFTHKWSGGPIRTANMGSGHLVGQRNTETGRYQKQDNSQNYAYTNSRAWSFPVPRITGDFYAGWKVKRIGVGMWMNYNETREAYFIEYGIHTSGNAVRRPVAKKSALDTLAFISSSGLLNRFADDAVSTLADSE